VRGLMEAIAVDRRLAPREEHRRTLRELLAPAYLLVGDEDLAAAFVHDEADLTGDLRVLLERRVAEPRAGVFRRRWADGDLVERGSVGEVNAVAVRHAGVAIRLVRREADLRCRQLEGHCLRAHVSTADELDPPFVTFVVRNLAVVREHLRAGAEVTQALRAGT